MCVLVTKPSTECTWNPKYACAGSDSCMLWHSSAIKRLPIPGQPVTFRLDNAVQFIAMPATPPSVIAAHPARLRYCAFMLQRARRAESSTRSHPPTSSSVKLFSPLASPASPRALTFFRRVVCNKKRNGVLVLQGVCSKTGRRPSCVIRFVVADRHRAPSFRREGHACGGV